MTEAHDHRGAAGVESPALRSLLEDHWEATMRRYPVWASRIGDRRYDRLLPGARPEDHARDREAVDGFLRRAAEIDPSTLGSGDRLSLDLFREDLESGKAVADHRPEEWTVLPRSHPMVLAGWLPELRPLESAADVDALIARYRAFGEFVDGDIATLRLGAADGRFANAESLRRTVEMVETELAKPTAEWAPVARLSFAGDAFPEESRDQARARALDAAEAVIRPALARYADLLTRELLPHAREGADVGLRAIPDGLAAYDALIRQHTSLALGAEEIHRIGLAEIAKLREEFAALGEKALGTSDIEGIFLRLRSDPALHFETADEVFAKAESALDAAREAMPEWFGRMPLAPCVVKRVPEHEAPYTTIAYYRPPAADGSRPGEYRINVHAPETRPRFEACALAFHEAIPGHHLQIAIAQELPELPAFRRHAGMTAYVEGWALYTERLADEMGLYETDIDRLGMLSFDAWRAARLVVDTGVHAMGWDRDRAIRYMVENTPLAENNIDNEVDRYVSWPGQALSYKLGQIEMWRLRREAEATRGAAFDIRGFHDVVLDAGALTLGQLERRVRAWEEADTG